MRKGPNRIWIYFVPHLVTLWIAGAILLNMGEHVPDFYAYWLAAKFLIKGVSPYDLSSWLKEFGDVTFLFYYPLQTALFFLPWAKLDFLFSFMAWSYFSMILTIASVVLGLSMWQSNKAIGYIFPIFAGLFIFRPLIVSIRNGQIGVLMLFFIVCSVAFYLNRKWVPAGICLGLLVIKPSIAVPFWILIGLWLIIRRNWHTLFLIFTFNLLLLLITLAIQPDWIEGFFSNGSDILGAAFGFTPSIWGVAHQICFQNSACTQPLGLFLSLLIVLSVLGIGWRYHVSFPGMVSLAISSMLLVAPYGWAYEQVLLIFPMIYILDQLVKKGVPFLVSALAPTGLGILSWLFFGVAMQVQHDVVSVVIPLILLIMSSWAAMSERPRVEFGVSQPDPVN